MPNESGLQYLEHCVYHLKKKLCQFIIIIILSISIIVQLKEMGSCRAHTPFGVVSIGK